MHTIRIKPLSVNHAWRGRLFKTPLYLRYQRSMQALLPPIEVPPEGPLTLAVEFGFSSRASDADNPLKPFLDCLQRRYGFNDSRIYRLVIVKRLVKRGCEFVRFSVEPFEESPPCAC